MLNIVCTVGGIIATFAFLAKDAPKYTPGYSIGIGFICLSAFASTVYFVGLIIENKKRDRVAAEGVSVGKGENVMMGDLAPDYRYML